MDNELAFITGASHGIGRAIAIEFARAGYALAINCRNSADELNKLAEYLKETFGVPCISLIGDVGDEDFVNDAFHLTEQKLGAVTTLVNNAGISHVGLLSDMSLPEWERIMRTNLTSVFCCCKHAIPNMVHCKSGRILNISSIWGSIGASCEAAYSASKGGVNALTKALAKELAPSGIAVNAIACGVIDTRMNQCFSEEERRQLAEEIPAGRFGSVQEVARLALSVATSPSYLTGQIITMDGGWQ